MKTIAILLLIAGLLLLGAAAAVFFLTDCRQVFRDLRTTKRFSAASEIDAAAREIYSSNILAYNNDAPPVKLPAKKRFQKSIPRRAVDDTAVLAGAAGASPKKEPAFKESRSIPAESSGTEPLRFLQETSALPVSERRAAHKAGTEPLRSISTEPLAEERKGQK